jgi:hypothetical protein
VSLLLLGEGGERVMLTRCRYYEGGISSVYFWDIDEGFAGCVLLKKGIISLLPSFYDLRFTNYYC